MVRGANVEPLFTSCIQFNARKVNDAIQERFHHLPLGTGRFWGFVSGDSLIRVKSLDNVNSEKNVER